MLMAQRFLPLLVALWAVVVSPTLCVGGWLNHPCAHKEPENHSCEESDGAVGPPSESHKHDCTHEDNCLADPCSPLVRPHDDHSYVVLADPNPSVIGDDDHPARKASCHPSNIEVRPPPNSHHTKGRPFADRDIPLLT
jgi:hypothetical protein